MKLPIIVIFAIGLALGQEIAPTEDPSVTDADISGTIPSDITGDSLNSGMTESVVIATGTVPSDVVSTSQDSVTNGASDVVSPKVSKPNGASGVESANKDSERKVATKVKFLDDDLPKRPEEPPVVDIEGHNESGEDHSFSFEESDEDYDGYDRFHAALFKGH